MDFLEIADRHDVEVKSSISQARKTKLSATNGLGEFLPIVSDHLDYITCEGIVSHPIKVALTEEADYEYPVGEITYYTDQYIYMDGNRVELRTLPHWAGEGFYKKYVDTHAFVNSDEEAFGERNVQKVDVGLDYIVAKTTLE